MTQLLTNAFFTYTFFAFLFLLSFYGVKSFRVWSEKKQLLDIPNERSSHDDPKPRGGGLIFVILSLSIYLIFGLFQSENFSWVYFFAAIAIAAISWLDDLYSISFVWRLLIHIGAASLIVWNVNYFQTIHAPFFGRMNLSYGAMPLTVLWIVWLTNAYNFMDGIDGLAGLQAVTAGLGWLIVGKILGIDDAAFYGGVIGFSSFGFLIHNWEPAKIFMGDVGSAFLGFTFAVIPLLAAREKPEYEHILPLIGITLLWFFIFDSVLTLVRRIVKKARFWEPHREHVYQKLVIKGYSHRFVTIFYGINSLCVLGATIIWLCCGNHFLWLVLPTIIVLSSLMLILSSIKKVF